MVAVLGRLKGRGDSLRPQAFVNGHKRGAVFAAPHPPAKPSAGRNLEWLQAQFTDPLGDRATSLPTRTAGPLSADFHIHADFLEIFPVALLFHMAVLALCLFSLRVGRHVA
jgi:hypothetical protein